MAYDTAKKCECGNNFIANSNRQKYCATCSYWKRLDRQKGYNVNYYQRNVTKMLEKSTRYNQSEKGKASEKLRAAVRSGKIKRQPCEVCNEPDAEGHHTDYSKPYEVRWLCRKHHSEQHLYAQWQIDMRNAGYDGGFLLSELIEACGDRFSSLYSPLTGEGWKAFGWLEFKIGGELTGEGNTPETAVAKLWLQLNKKV